MNLHKVANVWFSGLYSGLFNKTHPLQESITEEVNFLKEISNQEKVRIFLHLWNYLTFLRKIHPNPFSQDRQDEIAQNLQNNFDTSIASVKVWIHQFEPHCRISIFRAAFIWTFEWNTTTCTVFDTDFSSTHTKTRISIVLFSLHMQKSAWFRMDEKKMHTENFTWQHVVLQFLN